jgi:SNF2 family DNA or RNA helicase
MADLLARVEDGRIVLDTEYEHIDRVKRIMGAKWDKKKEKWTLPMSWTACLSLFNDFGGTFKATKEIDDWGYAELARRVGPARELRARMDLTGLDPKPDRSTTIAHEAVRVQAEKSLFPYQAVGAAFAAVTNRCMILDEQGTGKTAQMISALRLLHRVKEHAFPVAVVCPATVKTHWEREFHQWYPGLTVQVVKGSAEQRRKQLKTPAHVYILGYSVLSKHTKLSGYGNLALKRCAACGGYDPKITDKNCEAHLRELNDIPFKTVIADEAHRLLNPKSSQTRAVWTISDKATNRFALTGTPVQDNLADYWALLRLVAPEEFPHKQPFIDRYAVTSYNPWGAMEISGVNPLRADELQQVTQPYTRRMLKDIVLSHLPPLMPPEHRTVEMTGAQGKAYRDMKKTMMAELSGKTLVTTTPLVKATRLMQLASSYLEVIDPVGPVDPTADATPDVKLSMPSNKITALMDDIAGGDYDGTAGRIVFAQSRPLLEMLSKEMTKKGIDHGMVVGGLSDDVRQEAIDNFQNGTTKWILVSLAAGGAGLTLTAADTMIYLQRSWSSTQQTQSLARAHRIGSEIHNSIRQVHYLSEGSVEFPQLEALNNKTHRIEEILKDNTTLYNWMVANAA